MSTTVYISPLLRAAYENGELYSRIPVSAYPTEALHYRDVDGTEYRASTPLECVATLEYVRFNRIRVTIDYGYPATGVSWDEVNDISGYIGRTTGTRKGVILVHNNRSSGGGIILDHCILSIRHSNKRNGGLLYLALPSEGHL